MRSTRSDLDRDRVTFEEIAAEYVAIHGRRLTEQEIEDRLRPVAEYAPRFRAIEEAISEMSTAETEEDRAYWFRVRMSAEFDRGFVR